MAYDIPPWKAALVRGTEQLLVHSGMLLARANLGSKHPLTAAAAPRATASQVRAEQDCDARMLLWH